MDASQVWYASYGSNLSRQRFEHYLLGGTPAGGRRRYLGSADRAPPQADRPFDLPYRLRFGGASRTWGGGMAFIETTARGHTLARLYRISGQQFGDVHGQENGGDARPADLATLGPGQRVRAGGGNYPMIMCCGHVDSVPVYTFTAEHVPTPAAPAPAYLRTIATGLAEAHGLTVSQIVAYLRAAPTVDASYRRSELSTIAQAGVASAMVPPPRHSSPS